MVKSMVDRNLINDFDVTEDELEAFVGSDSMGMDDLQVGSPVLILAR